MAISETLFHFLLDAKGSRLQTIQKTTDARLHMNSKETCVEISGLQSHVEAAKEAIAKAEQEMVDQTVTIPATAAQLEMLMKDKGALAKQLQTQYACAIRMDRTKGEVGIRAPEDKREAARAAVEAMFAAVRVETITLHSLQCPLFVGTNGKNINALRKESGASLELSKNDSQLTISGEEAAVVKAKELVQNWMAAHTVRDLEAEESLAFAVVVGPNGSQRQALEKELSVEISVKTKKGKATLISVMGEEAKAEAAVVALQARIAQYAKENAVVAFPALTLRNAPELRRDQLAAKGKELEVTFILQDRRQQVVVQGAEEKLPAAVAFLTALQTQYAEYAELVLDIPQNTIGVLVGKKGENVQRLQERLGVHIHTSKERVSLWGLQSKLEAAKEAVLADLEERIMLDEPVKCLVKEVAFLTADRHAAANHIQEVTGASVRIPKELPMFGATEIIVHGNKRQVEAAIPLVREAFKGLVRETLTVPPAHLTAVLDGGVMQIQRLALESRCRITPEREQGTVLVVGAKEGVALVLRRFWEQLAALMPAVYHLQKLEEAEGYGLKKNAKTLEAEAAAKGFCLAITPSAAFLYVAASAAKEGETDLEAGKQWLEEVCAMAAKENRVIALDRERVPFLIGSHGARISSIRKSSGASLEIVHEDAVLVQGKAEKVEKAVELVEKAMEEYANTHRTLEIDPQYIGVLVGARGGNLQRLRQQYFTNITVEDDGLVKVSGSHVEQVKNTVEAIEKYLEEVREREGMGENGALPLFQEVSRDSRRDGRRDGRRDNRREQEEKSTQPSPESVWERLKSAPVLGRGGSDRYKSENGYTVEF